MSESNGKPASAKSEMLSTSSQDEEAKSIIIPGSNPIINLEDKGNRNDVEKLRDLTEALQNPLGGLTREKLLREAKSFAEQHEFDTALFVKGALLAQNPNSFEDLEELDEEDKRWVRMETTDRWKQPFELYFMTVLCAMAAIVQGMDEAVVNGAQLFYAEEFGIKDNDLLIGLVNAAPYLCCALLGCWLTDPLNRLMGRRGVIFLSCLIASAASIWEAFAFSTWQLFAARFVLGLGIGPKSATAPVYAAETAPAAIRGALCMMWQMWTAFGIMLGSIVNAALVDIKPTTLGWRLMLGSTFIPPLFVCAQCYLCPESPRWYITKGRYQKAFISLKRLRNTELQAARDLFYMSYLIRVEQETRKGQNLLADFVKVPRVRRAMLGSTITMIMQQMCGINVIAYYSSNIFVESGFTEKAGILASLGAGALNWLGALPAFYTIDTFGRRNLLLVTFPLMAACLLFTGLCFLIDANSKARIVLVTIGIYLFELVYSPGAGPVPFTYSAEVYPLHVRDLGMSLATAITWFFNAVLALSWPKMRATLTIIGGFSFYSCANLVGFILAFLFLRESKGYTLEELDAVFNISTKQYMMHNIKSIPHYFKKWILRRDVGDWEPLIKSHNYDDMQAKKHAKTGAGENRD